MSVHQTKDGRWFCQYNKPGTRKSSRKYFDPGSRVKLWAEAWDNNYRLNKLEGRILTDPNPTTDLTTFYDIALAYLNQKPPAESTQRAIALALQSVYDIIGNKAAVDLNMKDLTEFDFFLISNVNPKEMRLRR